MTRDQKIGLGAICLLASACTGFALHDPIAEWEFSKRGVPSNTFYTCDQDHPSDCRVVTQAEYTKAIETGLRFPLYYHDTTRPTQRDR